MVILWSAFVLSIGIYFLLSIFLLKPDADSAESRVVTFALTATGVFLAILSFGIKHKFLSQAAEIQSPRLVQTGLIIALALCESAALLGLGDYMVTGNRYYYVMFIVALLGILLHFPKRDHLTAATYRQQNRIEQN
jgi:putative exporter of polyketide antibiotics